MRGWWKDTWKMFWKRCVAAGTVGIHAAAGGIAIVLVTMGIVLAGLLWGGRLNAQAAEGFPGDRLSVQAAEVSLGDRLNGQEAQEQESPLDLFPGTQEWDVLDDFIQRESLGAGTAFTFRDFVQVLMDGDGRQAGRMILDLLAGSLGNEIRQSGSVFGKLMAFGIIGALFTNFSNMFRESQISETGFFLTCLLVFAVLAAAFSDSVAVAVSVLEKQVEFMKVLLPSYMLAAVWSGSSISAAAWVELMFFLLAAVPWLYLQILLPLVRAYLLLTAAGNLMKEDMLSKMTELLHTVIVWGTRSLLGVVAGFQLIQGMVLPYADAVKNTGIQKLLQIIPGIGQSAGAVTKMLLGSGVLIKNTMGAAAVVILILVSLAPLLKLAVLLLVYRLAAAVLQPVADKRLVACLSGAAEGQRLLLAASASGLLLFAITIALICAGTNGAYMA